MQKSEGSETMSPCYVCTDRAIGCHGVGKQYAEAKEILEKKKNAIRNDPVRGYDIAKAARRNYALCDHVRYH